MNLILLNPDDVRSDGVVTVSGEQGRHLIQVLMVECGHEVRIGLREGRVGVGTVMSIGAAAVDLHCVFEGDVPPRPGVDLLLALPRPKVLRRLWAQLAAIGVGRIILTNAERVERNYFDTHVIAPACYEPLLIEGLQQARDTRVPVVTVHRQFRPLIEDELDGLSAGAVRVVAHPSRHRSLREVAHERGAARLLLAVGPEGGWNDFELRLLEAHGFEAIGMGARTLRTDTACLALLALAHEALRR